MTVEQQDRFGEAVSHRRKTIVAHQEQSNHQQKQLKTVDSLQLIQNAKEHVADGMSKLSIERRQTVTDELAKLAVADSDAVTDGTTPTPQELQRGETKEAVDIVIDAPKYQDDAQTGQTAVLKESEHPEPKCAKGGLRFAALHTVAAVT